MVRNMEENIDKIRKEAIAEIKEKVRKNPKLLNPTNKERLEYQEKLKFINGSDFIYWIQLVGIMKNPRYIDNKYNDELAKRRGLKDHKEYQRKRAMKWRHDTGQSSPISDNEPCSRYFGEFIAENYVMKTFENPIPAPRNNRWYDWTCKIGQKIQHKARCLSHFKGKSSHWNFIHIDFNHIADYFILSGWKDRESLEPMYVWIFHRDEIIMGMLFWARDRLTITNHPYSLEKYEQYDVTDRLEKLKEICNKEKEQRRNK